MNERTYSTFETQCLEISGKDRFRFLQAMLVGNVQSIPMGGLSFSWLANSKGQHIGQFYIGQKEEAFLLWGLPQAITRVHEMLSSYLIADRVKLELKSPQVAFMLLGDLGDLPFEAPEKTDAFQDISLLPLGNQLLLSLSQALSPLGEALAFLLPRDNTGDASGSEAKTRHFLEQQSFLPASPEELEVKRIQNAWPLDGKDIRDGELSLMSPRLASFVSWDKGCFLGQEVFVRIRDKGRPPFYLCRVEGRGKLGKQRDIFLEGQVIGELRSHSPSENGEWLGLALIRSKFCDGNEVLQLSPSLELKPSI